MNQVQVLYNGFPTTLRRGIRRTLRTNDMDLIIDIIEILNKCCITMSCEEHAEVFLFNSLQKCYLGDEGEINLIIFLLPIYNQITEIYYQRGLADYNWEYNPYEIEEALQEDFEEEEEEYDDLDD